MSLAPPIPSHFGPFRRAALEESQDGWCAICGERPIPIGTRNMPYRPRKGHRFTCQLRECRQWWTYLCRRDWEHARTGACAPSGMIHRRSA